MSDQAAAMAQYDPTKVGAKTGGDLTGKTGAHTTATGIGGDKIQNQLIQFKNTNLFGDGGLVSTSHYSLGKILPPMRGLSSRQTTPGTALGIPVKYAPIQPDTYFQGSKHAGEGMPPTSFPQMGGGSSGMGHGQ